MIEGQSSYIYLIIWENIYLLNALTFIVSRKGIVSETSGLIKQKEYLTKDNPKSFMV